MRRRKEIPEFGHGIWSTLDVDDGRVLARRCDLRASTAVAVRNLSDRPITATMELFQPEESHLDQVFGTG